MSLAAGEKLGPYEILSRIGAGGMGEVYLAYDPRLDRRVAIKVSAAQFSDRFKREARAVAALNHGNVCILHDIGPNYLVMEYIEGESPRGPLPVETVLNYARQIAAAMDHAHEKGVVHRDLKPANIRVTPQGVVKVLDFGLARQGSATEDTAVNVDGNSPTLVAARTEAGVILGTASYMSPEQARGKAVDKRADIWAFGVVLYELCTGDRLFTGETLSDTIAQVLVREPDLARLPPELQRIVRWCLEKDTGKRLRDIADARPFLEKQGEERSEKPVVAAASNVRGTRLWQAIAVFAILAAAGIAAIHFREKPAPLPDPFRFQLPQKALLTATTAVTLSPDGRHFAFSATGPDGPQVFVQDVDGGEARALPNTVTGSRVPPFFWSFDSRYVVFSANTPKLRKVDIVTGEVQDIFDKPNPPVGGAWNRDGTIIFGSNNSGLWRVPASGGKPVPLTSLDRARREREHELPMFLPDGKHFIYLAIAADGAESGIYAGSLDDPPGKAGHRIVSTEFGARFVPVADQKSGLLLFLKEGALVAQPFDPEKLTLNGTPTALPVRVGTAYQTPFFSASPELLVYRSRSTTSNVQLTWVDGKSGRALGTVGDADAMLDARLSPDETRVAYRKARNGERQDLWVLDVVRGGSTRLTFGDADHVDPVWSPDSREIAYRRGTNGVWQIYKKRADGSGAEELLLRSEEHLRPADWSRDGRFLLYSRSKTPEFGLESIGVLPLDGGKAGTPFPFSAQGTAFNESNARFSPDGRYVAYNSVETGRSEIYVRPFSPGGGQSAGKWLVSTQGGHDPSWSPDGRKLLWVSLTPADVMAADVDTAHVFHAGVPQTLYPVGAAVGAASSLTTRGQALLLMQVESRVSEPIEVMVNWMAALKK